MQTAMYLVLAFLMGMIMSVYLPMNSSVSKFVGSSITANMMFFIVTLITTVFLFIIFGKFDTLSKLKDVPPYFFLAGFISAFVILGTTFLIPFIGARKFFILLIAGQVTMAIAVSHFGILESPKDPISIQKLIGALLVIMGAIISTS